MGLDTVEFLLYAEKKFDISIADEEASKVVTMADFTDLCHQKLLFKPNSLHTQAQVFDLLCAILRDKFGIKHEIKLQDKIVDDLRLD